MWKRCRHWLAVLLAAVLIPGLAIAQDYPHKPVRLVVPYAPGGSPDVFARVIGARLTEAMGQPFVVDNRPGAGGIAACEHVAKAEPDGYTLLVPDIAQLAVNPHLFNRLPYDPTKSFAPISLIGAIPLFLVVQPAMQVGTVQEFIAVVRARPGQLSYGTGGVGSLAHILMESFKKPLGLEIVHVPYKGSGASTPAFIGGHLDVLMTAFPAIEQHVRAGNAKLLAVTSPRRSPLAPDVPAIGEVIPGYDFTAEIGLLAPAGTPKAIVQRLAEEVAKAVRHPDTVQRLTALGATPMHTSPEAYAANIRTHLQRYEKAVRDSGAKPSD